MINLDNLDFDPITWEVKEAEYDLPPSTTCYSGEHEKFGIRAGTRGGYTSAQIYTVGEFDYETDAHYRFVVVANDGTEAPPKLTVNVSVTDVNYPGKSPETVPARRTRPPRAERPTPA